MRIIEARLLQGTYTKGLARGETVSKALIELADHPVLDGIEAKVIPQQLTVQFTPKEVAV